MDPITEPIPNEQNDNDNEEQIEQLPKKKELSQKQIDHLNAIRGKALERKREIKLQKHEEYKKQAMEKKVQRIEIFKNPTQNQLNKKLNKMLNKNPNKKKQTRTRKS